MRYLVRVWLPFLGYLGFLTYLLLAPVGGEPGFEIPDKVVHFISFGILAFLWARVVPASPLYLILVPVLAYGALTEWLQGFTATRSPEFFDLGMDGLGAVFGVLVYRGVSPWVRF